MIGMDHTSGGQRAAEVEATAEQLAEWARRRRARGEELVRELRNLGVAASAHTGADEHIAHAARLAAETLARGAHAYDDEVRRGAPGSSLVTSRDAPPPGATLITGRGDRPPFAEDLVAERPPHERDER